MFTAAHRRNWKICKHWRSWRDSHKTACRCAGGWVLRKTASCLPLCTTEIDTEEVQMLEGVCCYEWTEWNWEENSFLECLFSPFYWQSFLPDGMGKKYLKGQVPFSQSNLTVNLKLKGGKSRTGTILQIKQWTGKLHISILCANLLNRLHFIVNSRNPHKLEQPQILFAFIILKTKSLVGKNS